VHGDGDGGNPAESAAFPVGMGLNVAGIQRGWIWQLWDSHGDGLFGREPTGMVDKFGCEKFWSAYSI